MGVLLSEGEAAIDDVLVRLQEAADHYADTSAAATSSRFKTLCEQSRDSCLAQAESLSAFIRKTGRLPREPDTEREALELGIARVSAALADDEVAAHRDALLAREASLCEATESASNADITEEARKLMSSIRADSATRQAALRGDR